MRKSLIGVAGVATSLKTDYIEKSKREAEKEKRKRIGITIGTTCYTCYPCTPPQDPSTVRLVGKKGGIEVAKRKLSKSDYAALNRGRLVVSYPRGSNRAEIRIGD